MAHIIKVDGTAVKVTPKNGQFNNEEIKKHLHCDAIEVLPLVATNKETKKYVRCRLAYNAKADTPNNGLTINKNSMRLTGTEIGGDMLLMIEKEYCEA